MITTRFFHLIHVSKVRPIHYRTLYTIFVRFSSAQPRRPLFFFFLLRGLRLTFVDPKELIHNSASISSGQASKVTNGSKRNEAHSTNLTTSGGVIRAFLKKFEQRQDDPDLSICVTTAMRQSARHLYSRRSGADELLIPDCTISYTSIVSLAFLCRFHEAAKGYLGTFIGMIS